MRSAWEGFAADDPMYYIETRQRTWDRDEFFESGGWFVGQAMSWVGDGVGRERMLELGCGLGRLSVHFASHFAHVDAVDISDTMIDRARRFDPPANLEFHVISGRDLAQFATGAYDMVASFLVFQHIDRDDVVANYLGEIARVLRPRAAAVLQFDTRRVGLGRRVVLGLPDPLLPRSHRRHIRRYSRDPERLRALAAAAGLDVEDERGAGTAGHMMLLRRPAD
jgi:SAM-dependent methyltransferase